MNKKFLTLLISLLSCFYSYGQFQLVGSATQTSASCFTLTPDQDGQTGAVWYTQRVDISKPFDVYGRIYLGTRNIGGGDGMAFVLQQVSTNVGSSGGGLGYAGLAPSLALEFDTHRNQEFGDPGPDHMAIMSQGFVQHNGANNLEGPVTILPRRFGIAPVLTDGAFHDIRVSWNPATQTMLAYVDCNLRLRYVGDIVNDVFGGDPTVFWGFTASTGSASNEHRFCLDYVSFTEELRDTTTCGGEPVPLNVGTGAGNTFSWTPTTGLSDPTIPNPIATPVTTTTYVVSVVDDCGNTRTDSVTITVQSPVQADAGVDEDVCPGETTQLLASGGETYTWTASADLSALDISNPIASPTVTTDYIVTVTDSIGCAANDTVTVTVLPLPTIDAGNNDQVCVGNSIQLQASTADQYNWMPSGSLDDPTIANPTATPTNTTLYTLEVTDTNGCTNTDSVLVTVNPLPDISAGLDEAICDGAQTQLDASGGTFYSWAPGIGLNSVTIANPTANPTASTTYIVIGVDDNGCQNTDEVTITVNPLPIADAGADAAICEGEETTLLASGGVDYSWTPTAGLSDANIANPIASPTVNTVYTVSVTDANGCTNTDDIEVVVNAAPDITTSSDQAAICEGENTGLNVNGAVSYIWSPAEGLDNATSASPIATPQTTTTYTVIGTDANSCSSTAEVVVTVNALPDISAGNDQSICIGTETTLAASGGVDYTWSPTTGLSNPNIASPLVTPSATTTYTVTGTDANGCVNIATINVTVNPLPIADAGTNAAVCEGEGTTLQASGGIDYSWMPAVGLDNTSIANPIASPTATTTYTVTVTDANSCSNTATVDVLVNSLPDIQASTDLAVICEGETTNLLASGGTNYTWSPAMSLNNPNISNPAANPISTTQYTLTGTAANGCSNTAQITINVNPLPDISAGNDQAICAGNNILLQASGGVDYIWSPTTGLSDPTSPTPEANPSTSTQYTLTGTDANGCMNTATVSLTVNPKPLAEGRGTYQICLGEETGLSINGAESYDWSTGEKGREISVSPTQNTRYWVIPSTGGCVGDTFYVQVDVNDDLPILAAQVSEPSGFAPHTVVFNNLSTNAAGYLWDFRDGDTTKAVNPTHTFNTPGVYSVRLFGFNAAGCETFIDLEPIEVFEGVQIVPNVFTPNGDGINDEFVVQLGPIEQYHLLIYNRWGRLVFETTNSSEYWDGSYKGKAVSEGVYTYRLEAVKAGKQPIQMAGTITLFR